MAQEFEGPVKIKGSVEKGALIVTDGPLFVQDATLMVFIPGTTVGFLPDKHVSIAGGDITASESIKSFKFLSSPQLRISEMSSTTSTVPIAVHGGLDIKAGGGTKSAM